MIYGAVLAGGRGTRFGTTLPKQFLPLGGKPILIRSLETFAQAPGLAGVVTLCPADWVEYTEELVAQYLPDARIPVLPGGETRNETLMRAIAWIEETHGLDEETGIITHDAVRPFVTQEMIAAHIGALETADATDTVIPATDTIVVSRDGRLAEEIPDRETLWQSQTPQSFRAAKLRRFYESLTDADRARLTDACRIFRMKGEDVVLLPGARSNLKITWPGDFEVAEAILRTKALR